MAADSNVLMRLRPVTFLYFEEQGGTNRERQYGLIAEEVANLAPDLARFDEEAEPLSVRYEQLAPLLNEVQKQQRAIAASDREHVVQLAGRSRDDESKRR